MNESRVLEAGNGISDGTVAITAASPRSVIFRLQAGSKSKITPFHNKQFFFLLII